MIIEIFCCLVAVGLAVSGSFTFWPVQYGYDFYRPLVLLVAGYVAGILLSWIFVALMGCFVDQKHEHNKPGKFSRFWLMQGLNYINHHALIRLQLRGAEKIPNHERFLLVCNHRSKFDSMIISDRLGKKDIAFMTKKSNMKIPLGNKFMWGICYLPLDRDDKLQSLTQMRRAESLIASGATSIGVFPEGKRQNEQLLGEFHEGVFNIAIHTKAPIVVMTSWGTEKIHKNFPFKFTKVRQQVIAVIPYEEYADMPAKEVSDMVHLMMKNHLEKISHLK